MRRPVKRSASDSEIAVVLDLRSALPVLDAPNHRLAIENAAITAAEAVAAAAAAQVALEAASTAQTAVDVAGAAAAEAARRARQVAADAAEIVAAAAAVPYGRASSALASSQEAATGESRPASSDRMALFIQAAADAVGPQATQARLVARRVALVAEAAATAAVDAARVVAAQLEQDMAAAADRLAAPLPAVNKGGDPPVLRAATQPGTDVRSPDMDGAAGGTTPDGDTDAMTIRNLTLTGASPTTIAAAMNAGGRRTAKGVRWTAPTVANVQRLGAPCVQPVLARGSSADTEAQLLALAQDARARAEHDLEEAQRLGGLGSWSWLVATDEVTWSEQMHRLFGTDPAKFTATYEGFLARVHPDDREQVSESIASVFEGAEGYEFDHRVYRPDGSELWLHARGAADRDDDGRPIRLYGTALDKTAAKLAEQRDQQQARDLAQLAWHDGLTGLSNRSLLHNRLGHALAQPRGSLSVLLLDLDDFKRVNDTSGHAAGDRLLVDVAARLLRCVRGGDVVARLGGDEFAVVVEGGDPWQLASRILRSLDVPVDIDGRQVTPTASIGIATAAAATSVDELLLQADVAMYAAKAAGKSRVEHFDAAMADEVRQRRDLHEALREAVTRGEIVVHYQPIMTVGTESMSRVEALVRWQRPEGIVSPADFLPLAEETGLIVGIGQHVLRQACKQLRDWLAADNARSLSVNVSPLQLLAGDFADRTLAVLLDEAVEPHQVILEVTESLFLNTTPLLVEQLEVLRGWGIRVSIDDFGTGYSSLGRLHQLPIDSIKIDKSFVDLIRGNDELLPIIDSMISMAHALHLDVTAEGVETAEQVRRLVALGCDHLQGFYFARPSTATTAIGPAADKARKAWHDLREVS